MLKTYWRQRDLLIASKIIPTGNFPMFPILLIGGRVSIFCLYMRADALPIPEPAGPSDMLLVLRRAPPCGGF